MFSAKVNVFMKSIIFQWKLWFSTGIKVLKGLFTGLGYEHWPFNYYSDFCHCLFQKWSPFPQPYTTFTRGSTCVSSTMHYSSLVATFLPLPCKMSRASYSKAAENHLKSNRVILATIYCIGHTGERGQICWGPCCLCPAALRLFQQISFSITYSPQDTDSRIESCPSRSQALRTGWLHRWGGRGGFFFPWSCATTHQQ